MTHQSKWRVHHSVTRTILAGVVAGLAVGAIPAAADTIRMGAPIPVTGPYASDGAIMEKGQRLAIEHINADGGLLGKPIEYIMFDIGDLTPDKLQAAAAYLVQRRDVDVLINGYGGMGPDIPAFCPFDQPYIHNDATSNVIELRDQMNCTNIFMGSDVDVNYGRIVFRQMMALDYEYPSQRLAVVHGPYDWEFGLVAGAEEVAADADWEVVMKEEVQYDTRQWGGVLSRLHDAQPSLIMMELLDPASVNTFIDQYLTNPVPDALLYIGYTLSVPAFSDIVASGQADGILGMTLFAHRPNERGEWFIEAWKSMHGEEPPYSVAAAIYDKVMIWRQAVEEVGDVRDFQAIHEAMRNIEYDGISGVFRFNDQQYVESSDDSVPTHLLQVQDGEVRQIMIGSEKVNEFRNPIWMD